MARILLVDDEPQIIRVLRPSFEIEGFEVIDAPDAASALEATRTRAPDLMVLDLGLPDQDGKQVIQAVRKSSDVPIIVLSARHLESEKIAALDLGANDYVDKPFAVGELMARIRAALRSAAKREPAVGLFEAGGMRVDLVRRRVEVAGRPVHLTPREYDLLRLLVDSAGRTVPHRAINTEIWGDPLIDRPQQMRVLVSNLRQKLEADPGQPRYIVTDSGIGYQLAVTPDRVESAA
jgi:two-component system KDP operon response regulator KdpE